MILRLTIAVVLFSAFIVLILPNLRLPPGQATSPPWKTYISPISGFKITIPPSWKILNDELFQLRVSNSGFNPDLSNGVTPEKGQIIVTFGLTHAALENYSSSQRAYASTEGIPVTEWGRHLDPSGSFGITTLYRQNDPKIPDFEQTISQILSAFKFLNSPKITPTCRPRPACLDANPRCLLPETGDMCPPAPKPNPVTGNCKIGGCSGELCVDAASPDVASICIYRDEYACYKYAVCEKQSNGKCAWTQTPEYLSCIKTYK